MDKDTADFLRDCRHLFTGRVLEVGSLNVNGTIRNTIPVTVGVDCRPGPDVDMIVDAYDLVQFFGSESFDHVLCLNTLEHVEHWEKAMSNMWAVLKPGGLMGITVPTLAKGYHAHPHDYWRWTLADLKAIFSENGQIKAAQINPKSVGIVAKKTTNCLNFDTKLAKVVPK